MDDERITAVGLLTQRDVETLGPTFKRLWAVDHAPSFQELLCAIDEAEAGASPEDISKQS
jgi:hypothetical protein